MSVLFVLRKAELDALELCRRNLSLVEPDPNYKTIDNPNRGKCYYASVALLFYLKNSKSGKYSLMKAEERIGTHYWVRTPDGNILDPTVDQFEIMNRLPPYKIGKPVSVRPNFKKHLPILNAMLETSDAR